MFRRFAAYPAHGDALDFSPLREVGKLRFNKMSGARRGLRHHSHSAHQGLSVSFDIVFTDASARTRALDFINVDANFASQAARARSCGNRVTMLSSGNLAQLHWHGERRGPRLRLVGRQRLFFRFALGTNRGLESQTRSVLAGGVVHGPALRTN